MEAQNVPPAALISDLNQSNEPPAQTANNTLMGNNEHENNSAKQLEDQVNNF